MRATVNWRHELTCRYLCIFVVWSVIAQASAIVYDYSPDNTRWLRLNIPDGTTEVRGLLIYGNGAGGDSRGMATDAELVAFAKRIGFAVLATGYWGNFGFEGEFALFESSLEHYANLTGFAEIAAAPWLPMGHSNGGQMSYGLNALRPEKVIGFITSKGCCYNDFRPSMAALRTPGMLIAGENDTGLRRGNIRRLFEDNRPRGALWAWVEEENTGHDEGNSRELILPFLAECYRLRYPRDQSPRNGPVKLKPLNEWEGWLVDQTTWSSGFTAIYPYDQFPRDPKTVGWVPNERLAHLYRSFSSYNRVTYSITGSARNSVTAPATLTYRVNLTGRAWEKIEFYEGKTKLGEATPEEGSLPQVSLPVETGGFYTFLAVVTTPSQGKSATMLRRVFVTGPTAPTPFETWAAMNFPPDQRDRGSTPLGNGIPNMARWAFGLGASTHFDRSRLPGATDARKEIDGVLYQSFEYMPANTAREFDVSFSPLLSEDLVSWSPVEHDSEPDGVRVDRESDRIEVRVPMLSPKQFLRVVVDDPLPR